jgi:hypothetical protein
MRIAFQYRFEPIDWFDARKGYKRIGSGISIAGEINGIHANLWRSRAGDLVARLTSPEDQYCFIVKGQKAPPHDEEIEDVEDELARLLGLWISQGIDDWPQF